MACDFDITKENIYDYIIEDTPGADEAIKALSGICSQRADSQWIIAHGELPDNRQLNISSLGYFTIPKLYGLMEGDADISALDEIGALRVLGQDNLQADGSNVLIGYVDTGIDYLNDVFKDRLGNTRIQAIWDQTDKTGTDVANTYAHFGRVYEKDEIDRAIEADNNGENPYSYVAQRDTSGHGTLMASISAGSYTDGYVGVAPGAELLVVKLKQSKQYLRDFFLIKDDVPAFEESDIMLALRFLEDYAIRLGKPLIIIFGLGSANGSRTGASPLAEMMENLTKKPNISVITCMGNEANNKCTHVKELKGLIKYAAKYMNVDNVEFGVIFVDNKRIHEINKEYRNVDRATDVLSFPMFEKEELDEKIRTQNFEHEDVLGDIVISIEKVEEQAKEYGHSFEREFAYMIVHGFYHLMGYDHIKEEDKVKMRPKEENVLNKLGIRREEMNEG